MQSLINLFQGASVPPQTSSASSESYVDVLIVGAGPAGVMACNALAKNGVNVRIIDQRPSKVAAGHADGLQPRTIEVFQSYGLAQRLMEEGNQLHMAAFYNPGPDGGIELTDRVPAVPGSARYPFEVTLHQGAVEAIFLDSMRTYGVTVDRPITPVSIQLSEDRKVLDDVNAYPAKVVLKRLDCDDDSGTEVVHAKFVIGADGAHSWVRKAFNIAMEGEQTEYVWAVVDLVPDTDFPDVRSKCIIHSNNGTCMLIPREGNKGRLYIQLESKDATNGTSTKVDKSQTSPHQLLDVARKSLQPYTIKTPDTFDWWTVYNIGQRVASKFSVDDRVFIVGDACHTHSPKAGQGMNASMNDSHNLAWKLTHVLRGWAELPLLKTYELERRKYAQDLIDFDKYFAKLFSGKPRSEENEDGVSHELFLKIFQTFGGFTSGIGICYQDSLITNTQHQSYAKNLIVGQRVAPQVFLRAADCRPFEIQDLLPSDARFKIILFTGDTSDSTQLSMVNDLASELDGVLRKLVPSDDIFAVFEILVVCSDNKASIRLGYGKLPPLLRSHWSKVFIDDKDFKGVNGGDGYKNYGIDKTGAIVVVRPDGYVGMVAPLDKIADIETYFGSFASRESPRLMK